MKFLVLICAFSAFTILAYAQEQDGPVNQNDPNMKLYMDNTTAAAVAETVAQHSIESLSPEAKSESFCPACAVQATLDSIPQCNVMNGETVNCSVPTKGPGSEAESRESNSNQ